MEAHEVVARRELGLVKEQPYGPWMLSICPILSAAPRTLHRVLTILSALASERKGESSRAAVSAEHTGRGHLSYK